LQLWKYKNDRLPYLFPGKMQKMVISVALIG
jgi:hypothetical protein